MHEESRIDYIEIPAVDLPATRSFFEELYGWEFQEWGDEYFSFTDGRLEGGLRKSDEPAPASGVLIVFYSKNLERDLQRVTNLGADISQEIFSFPGGRRFHFRDPGGTEFAMWSAAE